MAAVFEKTFRKIRLVLPVFLNKCCQKRVYSTRLAEVGVLETPKLQGKYDTGQLFLHRVFGYRGVVLFPWLARVYDRDLATVSTAIKEKNTDDGTGTGSKEVEARTHTYYQVLIDSRDCPHIRTQSEAVTFLGNQDNGGSLYAIPGLDYVGHEDVLPYTTTEKQPIKHELFDKFLIHDPYSVPPFMPRDTLRAWQEKNHPWLELSDVHRETTENIRVTVMPFYMGTTQTQQTLVYWEPVLSKNFPAFQYSSHVSLQAPSGHMWGTYKFEGENGQRIDCKIPSFSLDSDKSPHHIM